MEENEASTRGFVKYERDERSTMMFLLQTIIRPFKPSLTKPGKQPPDTRLDIPNATIKKVNVSERQVEGLWVYDLKQKPAPGQPPTTAASNSRRPRRLIYFAGGAWQMPPSSHHWAFCTELARQMNNTTITLVSPPLAPRSPVSVAFPQIEATYKALLRDSAQTGETVLVGGDSSGGNIALSLVTWVLENHGDEEELEHPAAVLAISPVTDLRHDMVAQIDAADKLDPVLTADMIRSTARAWCPGANRFASETVSDAESHGNFGNLDWSFEDPRVSPVQADVGTLARDRVAVYGVTGECDVLTPEAEVFFEKCRKAGVEGAWLAWKGQMHCFPLAFRFRFGESREAMDWIVEICERH